MGRRGLLSDSGYHGDTSPPHFQRYVPSRAYSVGTHEIQNGRITSNFNVTPEQAEAQLRRRQSNCCKRCCARLGSFCCITKTSPACKLLIVACWFAFISLLVALNFRYAVLDDQQDIMLSAGDQQSLASPLLAATFCEFLVITSEQEFNAYKLRQQPTMKDTTVRTFRLTYHSIILEGERYVEDHFRILAGSSINVTIEIDRGVLEFYVIAGTKNWNEWKKDPHCKSCVYLYHPLGLYNNNECILKPCTFQIKLADPALYYIILYNPLRQSPTADVEANMTIYMNRTMYDTHALYNCTSMTSCIVPLDVFTHQSVMVEYIHHDPSGLYNDVFVNAHCVSRLYMYFVMFLGIPLFICLIALVVICKCKSGMKEHRRILEGETVEDNEGSDHNADENESSLSSDDRLPLSSGASPMGTSEEYEKMEIPTELINHI